MTVLTKKESLVIMAMAVVGRSASTAGILRYGWRRGRSRLSKFGMLIDIEQPDENAPERPMSAYVLFSNSKCIDRCFHRRKVGNSY